MKKRFNSIKERIEYHSRHRTVYVDPYLANIEARSKLILGEDGVIREITTVTEYTK